MEGLQLDGTYIPVFHGISEKPDVLAQNMSWSAAQNLSIVEFDDEIILEQDVLKRNHHAEAYYP